ncbi:protein FAR-RED IMPAIRED RESPONSE 1 isoform X1 [Nicotiana sylvestris]|uniref:Protein FAR1-RELATED SEQUENCE n=5 Tax=Nicotiana TaxID=4085 RepID=A0A1S4C3S0_TOBAC|nr:PREDICTED: protein FAR-RED IMPAIRED RESPONSE 1 isoform X1 [Nicotiana sylvestris]XP_009767066.1 PREDICTED: protein FAR-RED IMPAIRED RESPONSE 1 isoform X1 [Nicotiana sylvestris]XP_016495821.1 PREDICTED: protein FAR-RED IMPAIRED RESPONSE 1-like isoform X1 [Nicotiana tabacum]XP_016495822.1 PREDICTED: protein FAR-RED IMPAIRED RESPONSE 1-like isoform X1 [Nicotiana tabacum]XP_016495823.1 PREDICTED: protein FAR-RED IMPAIRED RESPONSE 1-like isoform X1 [Nicotiana tabacum]XP_016495824.1 PREDICTED: pro
MVDHGVVVQNSLQVIGDMVDAVDNTCHNRDGGVATSPKRSITGVEGNADLEPRDGIEFESHEAAYAFYQEYAKSMGFTTSIKNSRRSKKSKEFIDAKFACSRYGVTPESDAGTSRRPSVKKTDCKASMHVKRKRDGKWYIHEFIKDHNHELLPALAYHFRIHRNVKLAEKNNIDILHAVSERTRKMYVEMSRQCGGSQEVGLLTNDLNYQLDRGRCLSLEEGDAQVMLEYFMHIQRENPYFFYAIDLNEDQRLRNLFWIDAKSRKDYVSFSDVVFFDTSYTKSNEKMPFVLFVGVNHHCQPMLLGCALVADETKPTFVWLMKTWLRAVGGQAPKVMITDQDKSLKAAIEEVFPCSRHCFALWHVLERIPDILAHVVKQHENFMEKFSKCIFKSVTDEQFDLRWWKMVSRFELQENEWIHTLYEERRKWVPAYMRGSFFAGMSTAQRSESISSFFDKYIHKKISLKEFMRQYGMILQNRYEEEAVADFEILQKHPALKSPSPWEKQMSTIYTHAIFRKFQVEVLGVVGCHPKKEAENGETVTFRVNDCEKNENFMVTWNEAKSDVSCSCLLFEYKGFLCRHAMNVLQICGLPSIPSQYILKRWTKDAKNRQLLLEGTERITRVQRYNDLCRRAIELGEEGSLSEESYGIAFRVLDEALKDCVNVNNRSSTLTECSSSAIGLRDLEQDTQGIHATKTSRKKITNKKRKVHTEPEAAIVEAQDSLQQMDNLSVGGMTLNGYYGTQQNVQGLIQLNLMEPPHDGYYVNQQNMQGLGQLNTIAPGHDGFFGSQQSIPGLGHLDFRQPSFSYGLQEEPSLRASQLHGNSARHA